MSINDILNTPEKLIISSKEYSLEFDNMAYGTLEAVTQKGIFKIRELLLDNNLTLSDCVELVCCGLMKHNKNQEIEEARAELNKTPSIWTTNNNAIFNAFLKPLMPPEVYLAMESIKEKIQNLSEETLKKKKKSRSTGLKSIQ